MFCLLGSPYANEFMVPPSFNKELQYLKLLGWLVVKHRTVYGLEQINEDEGSNDFRIFRDYNKVDNDTNDDKDDDDDDEEEGHEFQ